MVWEFTKLVTSAQCGSFTNETVRLSCGCDDPLGYPADMALETFPGVNTELVLQFRAKSLCNSIMRIVQNSSGVLTDIGLPLVQGFVPQDITSCAFTPLQSALVASLTWQTAGTLQSWCLVPMPQSVCLGCVSQYMPGVTSPDFTLCASSVPVYWFIVSGQVLTAGGAAGAMSAVQQVNVTLRVQTPAVNPIQPALGTALIPPVSVLTDANGYFSQLISSPLLSKQFYEVVATAARTDGYVSVDNTVLNLISGLYALLTVAPGTDVLYYDFSTLTVSNITTTLVNVTAVNYYCQELNVTALNTTAELRALSTACTVSSPNVQSVSISVSILVVTSSTVTQVITASSSPTTSTTLQYSELFVYEWSYPLPAVLPLNFALGPGYNLGALQQNVTNPYYPLQNVSATPWLMDDSTGRFVLPSAPGSGTGRYHLFVPPMAMQAFCQQPCYFPASSIVAQQSVNASSVASTSGAQPLTIEASVQSSVLYSNSTMTLVLSNGYSITLAYPGSGVPGVSLHTALIPPVVAATTPISLSGSGSAAVPYSAILGFTNPAYTINVTAAAGGAITNGFSLTSGLQLTLRNVSALVHE